MTTPASRSFLAWVLSTEFNGQRCFLGKYCWLDEDRPRGVGNIGLFRTRAEAREANGTHCYSPARVERVRVTIEAANAAERNDA